MRWPWWIFNAIKDLLLLGHSRVQRRNATGQWLALVACPGANSATAGPRLIVGIAIFSAQALYQPLNTNLAFSCFPMENQCRFAADGQFLTLGTVVICKEPKAVLSMAL